MTEEEIKTTDTMLELVGLMTVEIGRFPTEYEVVVFIFGSDTERTQLLEKIRAGEVMSHYSDEEIDELIRQGRERDKQLEEQNNQNKKG